MPILSRNKLPIYNFFSAVSNLKETNLTAYLAYLLAAFPEHLNSLFLEKRERLESVDIEQVNENQDRYDIYTGPRPKAPFWDT